MPNKMLIDASHPEETRVVVTRGNRIEEFDFESQDKKQLRGNIYLARVTRVEPSLQAAFVEYGGNRHGFLAFSEIHPDYYQIPVADRQALLRADAEAAEAEEEEDEEERSGRKRRRSRNGKNRNRDEDRKASGESQNDAAATEDASEPSSGNGETLADIEPFETAGFLSNTFSTPLAEGEGQDNVDVEAGESQDEPTAAADKEEAPSEGEPEASQDTGAEDATEDEDENKDDNGQSGPAMAAAIEGDVVSEDLNEEPAEEASDAASEDQAEPSTGDDEDHEDDPADEVESVGAEDAIEEAQPRRRANRRQYKIQEVIKRRQILLVQVVKEERGNKGAALTTYLSLAGRYSVLMPNTARGGGISRKITNIQDRKRLKDIVKDLEVPQGMGVILRTAGESRTKPEIKRDYEYLMRLWENVRTLTLQSTAPALVYEEGSLIKRSVRDLYNKDIEEIQVAGEDGYREAKDFMRMLMPSHAKMVQPYRDTVPIFARNGIEAQLDRMLQPQVNLKSGGYIIINQTEALVAIDVNSGRSTKEHSIEDTALQTNLEAADEVARQLRLRDLAGLIVVDFIDMEENRNNRAVEKRMKDALKNDRARIQVGRISHFGLLEMSRQRIRASVLESTTQTCPHCGGTGHIRSESSVALHVIRAIEEYLLKDNRSHIVVRTPVSTALYVLNHKRSTLVELERRFGVSISMEADETLGSQHYAITKGAAVENPIVIAPPSYQPVIEEEADDETMEPFDGEDEVEGEDDATESEARESSNGNGRGEHGEREQDRKRRRRRRRRGGRDRDTAAPQADASREGSEPGDDEADADAGSDSQSAEGQGDLAATAEGDQEHKKRRRGKRGGRRNRREDGEGLDATADEQSEDGSEDLTEGSVPAEQDNTEVTAEAKAGIDPEGEIAPVNAESSAPDAPVAEDAVAAEPEAAEAAVPAKAPRARARRPRKTAAAKAEATEDTAPAEVAPVDAAPAAEPEASPAPDVVAEAAEEIVPAAPAEAPAESLAAAAEEEPARPSRRRASSSDTPSEPVVTSNGGDDAPAEKPRKGGWWQRKSFF